MNLVIFGVSTFLCLAFLTDVNAILSGGNGWYPDDKQRTVKVIRIVYSLRLKRQSLATVVFLYP